MKKITAFILSLLLLLTAAVPLPVQAADGLVITRIDPDKIKSGESVRLYIYGSGLSNVNEAYAGGKALEERSVLSDTQVSCLIPGGLLTNPGKVDIMVKTSDEKTFTLPGALTVLSSPQISKVHRSGLDSSAEEYHLVPTFGGYPIVVEGKQFQPGLRLFIGAQEIEDIQVSTQEGSDETTITAVAPRSTVGGKEIKVINPDGQQALLAANADTTLRYRISGPKITAVSPNYGSTVGETLVTITGEEFDTADRVRVGMGLGFAQVKSVAADHKTLVISTPPGNVGQSDLVITNADLAEATGKFEYVITPTISFISPNYGPTSGGTTVTIQGTNFPPTGNLGVRIGGQELGEIVRQSDTVIIVETKNGPPGPAAVEVYDKTDSKKSFTKVNGFTFKEQTSQPKIDKISPNAGDVEGGDEIIIEGSDFLAGDETKPTRVLIGGRDCSDVLVASVNEIRAKTPAGQAGWRPVEVVNPDGGSVKTNYGFQYKIPDKLLLITGVTPNRGSIDENKYVVVSGANFLGPGEEYNKVKVEVLFGGNSGVNPKLLDSRTISVTTPLGGALGAQTVVVRITREGKTDDGETVEIYESAELPAGYIYEPPKRTPVVERVLNPETGTAEGPLAGGVKVYIYGHYFETRQESLPEVYFGDLKPENRAEVLGVGIEDPNHNHDQDIVPLMYIEVVIPPAKASGMVSVWVANPALEEGQTPSAGVLEKGFVYRGNLLHLMAVTPDRGPIGGGTFIEIAGKNFDWSQDERIRKEKTSVFIGSEEAEIKSIEINKEDVDIITAITPPGKVGLQDVKVVNPFGDSVLKAAFNYYDKLSQPLIESVDPNFGNSQGGTVLTLVGTGFASGAKVFVGRNQALQVDVTNLLDQDGNPVIDEKSNQIKKVITCLTPAGEPGPVPIRVVNADGGEDTVDGEFIYLSAPEITSITPASGTVEGGTWVVLKGKGFLAPETVREYVYDLPGELKPEDLKLQVRFSTTGFDKEASQVVLLSPTEVAVKTPAGPYTDKNAGIDVELINPDAVLDEDRQAGRAVQAKGYEYRVPTSRPEIGSLDPTLGPIMGGTKVVITGSDFRQDVAVFFQWKPAAKVTRIDYDTLEVITPPAPEDWVDEKDGVDVTVINMSDGGQSNPGKFQYVYPRTRPEFHSIVPDQGSVDGGTLVTIRGYDFGNKKITPPEDGGEPVIELELPTVYFGNDKANVIGLNDERTVLRVRTPAHAAGTVDVRIINPDSATVTANSAYTYRHITTDPVIQSVAPDQGRASGGTPVVIAGSGFSTGAKVYFNDQEAKVDTAKSLETILFVYSPPGKAGEKADVTVLNPDGASYTVTEVFEYIPDPKLQPRITQIVPNKGPITGGTLVDIWGVNMKHQPDHEKLRVLIGYQEAETIHSSPDADQDKANKGYVQRVQIKVPRAEKSGPVDVAVINADGGVFTVPGGFTYTEVTEPIKIDSIVPSKGPYLVDIPAQINGSSFLAGAQVFLGRQELDGLDMINGGIGIAFTIPAAPQREEDLSLDVVVMNPNGATARIEKGFTYVAQPTSEPKISQVVPGSGRASGGTPVTVQGQGFVEQTLPDGSKQVPALFFGGRLAAKTTFLSGEQLSAITPPGPVGPVNVTVINPDGAMFKLVSGFIYEDKPGPQITSISPTSGPSTGGTEVTIIGSQFDQGVKVSFGSSPVRSLQRKSDTELVVVTLEGELGTANITVTNPDGSSYTLPDAFTYVGPPRPPEGLEARAVSANTIELRWLAATGAASYEIYLGESRSDQYFLASANGETYGAAVPKTDEPTVLYYYAQDLEVDTRYYFNVRAVNETGVSGQTWTASARTLKRSASEPEDTPAVTEFQITRGGTGEVVITIPPALLKDSRLRLDLMKPEYENERTFTIIVPAAEVDRRSTIYLSAPRLKLELPVRAVNTVEVRSLSRGERDQASVDVTVEEARGSDVTALLRKLPAGWTAATPVYRLAVKLSSGGQEKELAWLDEQVTLTTKFDFANAALQQPTLYYYDPTRDTWTPTGYFSAWSADAALDRPGYWVVLTTRR